MSEIKRPTPQQCEDVWNSLDAPTLTKCITVLAAQGYTIGKSMLWQWKSLNWNSKSQIRRKRNILSDVAHSIDSASREDPEPVRAVVSAVGKNLIALRQMPMADLMRHTSHSLHETIAVFLAEARAQARGLVKRAPRESGALLLDIAKAFDHSVNAADRNAQTFEKASKDVQTPEVVESLKVEPIDQEDPMADTLVALRAARISRQTPPNGQKH